MSAIIININEVTAVLRNTQLGKFLYFKLSLNLAKNLT